MSRTTCNCFYLCSQREKSAERSRELYQLCCYHPGDHGANHQKNALEFTDSLPGLLTGEGFATGGRVPRLSLALRLNWHCVRGGRFEFRLVALFELPVFAFLFVGGRLLLDCDFQCWRSNCRLRSYLCFCCAWACFVYRGSCVCTSLSVFGLRVASGTTVADDSPSFTARLISMAVCPALTISRLAAQLNAGTQDRRPMSDTVQFHCRDASGQSGQTVAMDISRAVKERRASDPSFLSNSEAKP